MASKKKKAAAAAPNVAVAEQALADADAGAADPAAAPVSTPNIPHDQVGDALLAGQLSSPAPDLQVPVVVGDGSIQTVAAKDLASAQDQGWTIATSSQVQRFREEQKYESASAQARTAAEAGARGLTLGLSDQALKHLGVDMADVAKRQELNPGLALGGEIVGAAAPILLSGGSAGAVEGAGLAGTAARAASTGIRAAGVLPRAVAEIGSLTGRAVEGAVGRGIVGRGLSMAASGAAEGGLYGLGQAVSENAIRDAPLTAERVLAHVGMGALFGGAGGAVLGSAEAGVEKALTPLFKKVLTVENVERFVSEHGLRQWAQGRGKMLFKKLRQDFGDDAAERIGRVVKDEGLDAVMSEGATWQEMHQVTSQKLNNAGRQIGETMRAIDRVAPPRAAAEAAERIASQAETEILDKLGGTGLRSDKTLAKKLKKEIEWLWTDESVLRENIKQELAEAGGKRIIGKALDREVTARVAAQRDLYVPSFEKLHQLRARLDDIAFPKGAGDATPYQKALQELRGITETELTSAADKAAEGAGSAIASNYSQAKQRYRALKWLDGAAENNAASDLANRQFGLTDTIVGSSIGSATLMRLLSGDMSALGSAVIATATGAAAGLLNKQLRTMGQNLAARTGEKVLTLMKASEKMAGETDAAVHGFFASKAAPAVRIASAAAGESLREKYDSRRSQLEQFNAAPEAKLKVALGDTDQTAPAVASAVRGNASRAAQFLQSKLPPRKTRASDIYAHLDDHQREPDSAMARFNRYFDAVSSPRSVLKDFSHGKATREGVEALRAVYPQIHQQLAEGITRKLAEHGREKHSYQKLVQMSLVLGKPLHPSLEPRFIAACQAVHQQSRQQGQQSKQAGVTPGNRKAPQSAGSLATASQQLETPA